MSAEDAQAAARALKARIAALDADGLDLLFREARTYSRWRPEPVSDEQLERLHALARMGPTSFNTCPARFAFVRTAAGKERLRPALSPGNVDKTMAAPVTAIVAYDLAFYEALPTLRPDKDESARGRFVEQPERSATLAFRNGTLQGAYLMLAARALGLDCGPMSGFDNATVDAEFFAGTSWRSNFLCNLGYGDPEGLGPRHPRLAFGEACRLE